MRYPEVRTGQLTHPVRGFARLESCRIASARSVAALLIVGFSQSACYRYVPIAAPTVRSNEEVRVRVTEDAAARLSKELGAYVMEIDGQWVPQGSDSVSIAIPIERTYRGMTVGTTSQVLYLARNEVVEVRKREFDRARTILVSAGAVVGFGLLAAAVVQLADPNPDSQEPPPPPPAPTRIPTHRLFKVRIPIP